MGDSYCTTTSTCGENCRNTITVPNLSLCFRSPVTPTPFTATFSPGVALARPERLCLRTQTGPDRTKRSGRNDLGLRTITGFCVWCSRSFRKKQLFGSQRVFGFEGSNSRSIV